MDCEEHTQIGLHKLLVKQKGNQTLAVRQGWTQSKVFVHIYAVLFAHRWDFLVQMQRLKHDQLVTVEDLP